MRGVRVGRRPEDDLVFRHRRRIQPHQGLFLGLQQLFEQVLQHLPLKTNPFWEKAVFKGLSRMDMNRKRRIIAGLYAAIFGGFSAYVIWNAWANRLFAEYLDLLCTPVRLGYGLFFGSNDAYLDLYFVACLVYMAGLGYALGFFLHKVLSQARRRVPRP